MTALIVLGVILFFVIFIVLPLSIKIVREFQRLVIFRLGRMIGPKGPGLVFLIPIIDRPQWVDLREFYLEIPHQTSITKDNAPISIDFITFYKVVDPVQSVVAIQDFAGAALNIAATTLRSVVGDISLDDVLAKREEINQILRAKLDEITERWGVKVTSVQEAMTRQMSAERSRRAVVTEADGTKEAAVTVAEGDKQANILKAEGERQAAILRSEGFALALKTVFEAAKGVDAKTMGLQYLEALKVLGASPSTKFILPLEFTGLLRGVSGYADQAFSPDSGGNGKAEKG